MHMHAYACICMRMHACACICMHIHMLAHACMCLLAYACICMHIHMLAHACMCMHMHAYAFICMHMHTSEAKRQAPKGDTTPRLHARLRALPLTMAFGGASLGKSVTQQSFSLLKVPVSCCEGGGSTILSDHQWGEGQLGIFPDIPPLSSGSRSKAVCATDFHDSAIWLVVCL